MNKIYGKLLVELKCPVCMTYMAPPIRQCAKGHSICEPCMMKLPKCTLCQSDFAEGRNVSLEAMAAEMQFPCVYRTSGCNLKLSLDEKATHEGQCSFRGFRCPICPWIGKAEDVVEHWASKQTKTKPFQAINICHSKVKPGAYFANLIQAYNQLFWFRSKQEAGKIFWAVQLLGNQTEASKYYYEIEVFKPAVENRSKTKSIFSDHCQSAGVENDNLFKDDVCIGVNTSCIERFLGNDQILIYYMRVLKVDHAVKEKAGEKNKEKSENANQSGANENQKSTRQTRPRSVGAVAHAAEKAKNTPKKKSQPKQKNQNNENNQNTSNPTWSFDSVSGISIGFFQGQGPSKK